MKSTLNIFSRGSRQRNLQEIKSFLLAKPESFQDILHTNYILVYNQ